MAEELATALKNALISFDCVVRVSDLVEQYKLPYKEAHAVLQKHLERQEREFGEKFVKRYLVQGSKKGSDSYTQCVVPERDVDAWLRDKLIDATSLLYSVELAGGAKAAPQLFKPARYHLDYVELEKRKTATARIVADVKQARPTTAKAEPPITPPKSLNTLMGETRLSPKKPKGTKLGSLSDESAKGRINEMFTNAAAAKKEPQTKTPPSDEAKPSKVQPKAAAKKPAQSSLTSLFSKQQKKNDEKPKPKQPSPVANKSMQLFGDSSEEEEETAAEPPAQTEKQQPSVFQIESESSDEEEQLDALRRQVLEAETTTAHADDEAVAATDDDDVDEPTTTTTAARASKRRRIIDSDSENSEADVVEKVETTKSASDAEMAADTEPEAYLDDDGFVVTVKSQKKQKPSNAKRAKTTISPPLESTTTTKKQKSTPDSAESKPKAAKKQKVTAPAASTKTKQNSIMSYFSKK